MVMISKFFIDRPIFATVIAILMVLAGVVTLNTLPVAQFPDITPPTVQVTATYPGASAETVARTVGAPIEEQVNGVDGMIYMSSSSSSSGQYTLTVTFEVGTDIDMATVLVQNRVNIAQGSLPEAVIQQGIITRKQSTNIVMFLSLQSDNAQYDGLYLSNYATLNLTDELSRLPGVGSVNVFGAGDYSMRIWLDPEVMRIRQLTPSDVYAAVQSQNMEVSAGTAASDEWACRFPVYSYGPGTADYSGGVWQYCHQDFARRELFAVEGLGDDRFGELDVRGHVYAEGEAIGCYRDIPVAGF